MRTCTHAHRCVRGADVVAKEESELLTLLLEDAWPLLDQMPNLWYTLRDMADQRSIRLLRFAPAGTGFPLDS